jgi:hypothetical protein
MRFLHDTQVMLWWLLNSRNPSRLSQSKLRSRRCAPAGTGSVCDQNCPAAFAAYQSLRSPVDGPGPVEGLMAVSSDRHWPEYDVSLHHVCAAKPRLADKLIQGLYPEATQPPPLPEPPLLS